MESNKAPVHDFAPAWLKIPETQKSNKSITSSSLNASIPTQDNFSFRPKYLDNDLKIRNNINTNNNNNKIFSADLLEGNEQNKNLYESISNDHQNKQINGGNLNYSNINDRKFYKPKIDTNRRPHSRHDFRDATSFHHSKSGNVDYGNNSITSAAVPSSSLSNTAVQVSTTTKPSISTNLSNTKDLINEYKHGEITKLNKIKKPVIIDSNTEFPSLIDDKLKTVDVNKSNGSIWNNAKLVLKSGPRSSFTILQKQNLSPDYFSNNDNSTASSVTSSALNNSQSPSTTVSTQQKSITDNGSSYYHQSLVSKRKSFNSSKDNMSYVNKTSKWLPLISGGIGAEPPLSTMELLVRNPKIRSNKNEFLRTLRSETSVKNDQNKNDYKYNEDKSIENKEKMDFQTNVNNFNKDNKNNNNTLDNGNNIDINNCINNNNDNDNQNQTINKNNNNNNQVKEREDKGINISKLMIADSNTVDKNGGVQLSSSLEAEERLLKEMGWKEIDEDDNFCAPLTEDEVKEFRDLIMSRNGFEKYKNQHIFQNNYNHHNNRNTQNNQFNWSPKRNLNRVNGFISSPEIMDEDTSSSSSDDDDDDNDNLKIIV